MAKTAQNRKEARDIQNEAMRIARSRQLPGQTKEQTRLIAQGIQKGIEQYRRQESSKARDRDKQLKRLKKQSPTPESEPKIRIEERIVYRQHWLPWVLLALSWTGIGIGALIYLNP